MNALKAFSLAVGVGSMAAAFASLARGFDPPLFFSLVTVSLMALSFYYFEIWYDRWKREAEPSQTPHR